MFSHQLLFIFTLCFCYVSFAQPANKRDAMMINLDSTSSTISSSPGPTETQATIPPTTTTSLNTAVPTEAPSTYHSSKFQVTFTYKDTTPLADAREYFSWYASIKSVSKASKSASKSSEAAAKATFII